MRLTSQGQLSYRQTPLHTLLAVPPRNGIYKPKEHQGFGVELVKMHELFKYQRIYAGQIQFDCLNVTEQEKSKLLLEDHDLLFSRTSVDPEGVGKCSIVRVGPHKLIYDSNIIRFRLDTQKASPLFYFYYFNSPQGRDQVKGLASGAAITTVTGKNLSTLSVPYPSTTVQNGIASILSAYDDLIENNTRRIKILEEMAQAIYREWFVHFRFPDHKKVRMVDSELGPIPEGWEVRPAGELLSYHIGGGWGKDEQSEQYPDAAYVIRGTDIPSARHTSVDSCPLRFHKRSNLASRKLQLEDIVFEVSGGSKDQPVGRTLLAGKYLLRAFDDPVICASFCKLLRPNQDRLLSPILYLHLLHIYRNRRIEKYQVQSTGISNLKFRFFLESDVVVVPDLEIQTSFQELVAPLFDAVGVLGARNSNLRRTRDLLLPKLISGEVDVSQVQVDSEITQKSLV